MWQDLGSAHVPRARRAAAALAAAPEKSLPGLQERVRPAPLRGPRWLEQRLADLDDDSFAVRETAQEQLEDAGRDALAALQAAVNGNLSLEARTRIKRALEQIRSPRASPRTRREMWVVELLEQLGTSDARAFLKKLAAGAPEAWLTREAKASLQRLPRANPQR